MTYIHTLPPTKDSGETWFSFRAKRVKVSASLTMRFAAKTKIESISLESE